MITNRRKVLILIDWFLPGIKAGGPIKSVSAIVNQLCDNFDFYVLTTDTDFGDITPYEDVKSDEWIDHSGKAKVCYLSKEKINTLSYEDVVRQIEPDVIYINSFFSKYFSIIPLKELKKINYKGKIIVAPRGMLSEGALKIKSFKKKIFIAYSKFLALHKNIVWHSTKTDETSDIRKVYENASVIEIQNLPDVALQAPNSARTKEVNELRLIYLGRIVENKNLLLILNTLSEIKDGYVALDIFGTIEDSMYWSKCEQIIKKFGNNIKAQFKGVLQPALVQKTISNYHYLVLFSYSENYGHAIVESFSCGTPVIISNTTPWKNLEKTNAGWDVEINQIDSTVSAIKKAIKQNNEDYQRQSLGAYHYAELNCFDVKIKQNFISLFS